MATTKLNNGTRKNSVLGQMVRVDPNNSKNFIAVDLNILDVIGTVAEVRQPGNPVTINLINHLPTLITVENPPTEDETGKAPSSEWAFDHAADVAVHHARYTDAEAQAACGRDGDLYWSRPGNGFIALDPQKDNYTRATTGELIADENALDCMVAVNLPNGCTVTAVIVYGNVGLSDKIWELHGAKMTDLAQIALASAAGNTEDTTITNAVIDNSLYTYCLHITDLDNTDEIYGARITYTF